MLAVALSFVFGLIAFAALAQVWLSIRCGLRRGRGIMAELAAADRTARQRAVGAPALSSPVTVCRSRLIFA